MYVACFWYSIFHAFRICSDVHGHQIVKESLQDLLTGELAKDITVVSL